MRYDVLIAGVGGQGDDFSVAYFSGGCNFKRRIRSYG